MNIGIVPEPRQGRAFDVPGTSFIVIADRAGKVVYTGLGDKQDLVTAVRKALQVP